MNVFDTNKSESINFNVIQCKKIIKIEYPPTHVKLITRQENTKNMYTGCSVDRASEAR